MSIFVFGGFACLVRNVQSVKCSTESGKFRITVFYFQHDQIAICQWQYESEADRNKVFKRIVTRLRKKGWGVHV